MIDLTILNFSFLQGVFAFFAPCAVALLPGYISAFVTRNNNEYGKKQSNFTLTLRALKLAFLTIAGFITIYGIAGVLIALVSQFIKDAMPYIASAMGVIFMIIGILMLAGKNISLNIHLKEKKVNSESLEAYLFGLVYAVGALGCLFPLFLTVVFFALDAPNVLIGTTYLATYLIGMSLFMLVFTLLAVFAKNFLRRNLSRLLPHMNKIAGVLLILAGSYVIWYQSSLF